MVCKTICDLLVSSFCEKQTSAIACDVGFVCFGGSNPDVLHPVTVRADGEELAGRKQAGQ